jgi:hypothetical protein
VKSRKHEHSFTQRTPSFNGIENGREGLRRPAAPAASQRSCSK